MSKIDWDKPLLCQAGDASLIYRRPDTMIVEVNGIEFEVDKLTGVPVDKLVINADCCAIRNKKSNRDKAIKVLTESILHTNTAVLAVDALIEAGQIKD